MTKRLFLRIGIGRKWLAAGVMAVMLAAILPINTLAATSGTEQYISDTKAKAIALEHAGIASKDATILKVRLDYDDGRTVYDIEFYSGSTEYDYEIDAVSGEIYEFDRDIEYYNIPNSSQATTNAGEYIGEAKAKSIALTHAGVAESQATFLKSHLDYDGGRVDYDIEFYVGDTEYDYEIDAVSGNILEYDRETKTRTPSTSAASGDTSGYIGEAKAKSIALSNAGLSESQVTKMKVKLDHEHGRTVYEVDFLGGRTEYEYEIDATSGAILESDVDYDD
jgi:uncharacterized membrane protein YkoI